MPFIGPPEKKGLSAEETNALIDKAPRSAYSVWSILEVVDKMDEVAIEGTGLTLVYADHWNDDAGAVRSDWRERRSDRRRGVE